MRIPRDIKGDELIRALHRLGYESKAGKGSHKRIFKKGFAETIPAHKGKCLRQGLLGKILKTIARNEGIEVEALMDKLDI